jgi:hypothetical protein
LFFTNHVLAGALIGRWASRPIAAFALGLASHVVMDVVPHWGEDDQDRFLAAARRDGLISLVAMTAAVVGSGRSRAGVVAGMAGAGLLDLDKPVRHFTGRSCFPAWLDNFHGEIQQGRESPHRWPAEVAAGAVLGGILIGRPV